MKATSPSRTLAPAHLAALKALVDPDGALESESDTLAKILRACGFEASLVLRHRDDVDQSQIALHLAMTPAQRVAHLGSGARAIDRAQRATRVPTRA